MKYKLIAISILFTSILNISCKDQNSKNLNNCTDKQKIEKISSNENYVILLSLDGFRYDYIEKFNTKNLKKIAKNGVHVKRMNPSNPTKTFPNHYTIVTGLYPENHGIVGNSFYDEKLGEYSIPNRNAVENGEFYGGEPIWNTAKKAGLKTASYFWVGSEAPVNGMQPDFWEKYNQNTPFIERINTVISWLKLPKEERPRLITLYYHQPDSTGHGTGPESEETSNAVNYVDEHVDDLYNKLMDLPISKNINLIIVSDHGMSELDGTKKIFLENYINLNEVIISGGNPTYTIKVKDKKNINNIYNQLKKIENLDVYKQGEAPKKLHVGNHHRMGDMMIFGKEPYVVFPKNNRKPRKPRKFGVHGFLNTNTDMGALFIATGNTFKKGYTQESINNTDVYNLICKILNIKPAKNDGNFENVKTLLKEE